MNRIKVVATILCLSLAALAFSPGVKADGWNKKTVVTFSQPVEIPGGIVLPAGTYVIKLLDSLSNRHIVQIFNEDQTHIYATILAIPNWRLDVTDKTVMTFGERAAGDPQAIRSWFYPGDNFGQEFVYPKRRAVELAKITNLPILAMPTELESEITKPAKSVDDEPVVALKQAPLTAVKPTGEEVEIAQVITPPPAQQKETADATERMEQLPQTASLLPLFGLIGLLSLGAGFALMGILKRTA
jgi:hypothetical protein